MANIAVLVVLVVVAFYVSSLIRRRSHGLVPKRGIGVSADLGALRDKPRVRVQAVRTEGPDRVRIGLTPEPGHVDGAGLIAASDLDLVVLLREDDFGFEVLLDWKTNQTPLAMVVPPDSRIVRLRSIDGLQPLTLRRAGGG